MRWCEHTVVASPRNATKRRICVLVTARPSYSRIRSALHAIQHHPDLELQLVVGASALLERYGNAIHAIEHDGVEVGSAR